MTLADRKRVDLREVLRVTCAASPVEAIDVMADGLADLTGATQVRFDGIDATGFTVVNGTTITATAPAHAAGSADVRVTTPSGTSANTAADDYTYIAAPTVTNVAPSSGPSAAGSPSSGAGWRKTAGSCSGPTVRACCRWSPRPRPATWTSSFRPVT